jgi:hypothetical protein
MNGSCDIVILADNKEVSSDLWTGTHSVAFNPPEYESQDPGLTCGKAHYTIQWNIMRDNVS